MNSSIYINASVHGKIINLEYYTCVLNIYTYTTCEVNNITSNSVQRRTDVEVVYNRRLISDRQVSEHLKLLYDGLTHFVVVHDLSRE